MCCAEGPSPQGCLILELRDPLPDLLNSVNTGKYAFVMCAPYSWRAFNSRLRALSLALSRRGHTVFFLEPMRSPLGALREQYFRRCAPVFSNEIPGEIEEGHVVILTPPFCSSYFRGGVTVAFDRKVFKKWFQGQMRAHHPLNEAVYVIGMPTWWLDFIPKDVVRPNTLLYDYGDSLETYSRTKAILDRMIQAEREILHECDGILSSTRKSFEIFNRSVDASKVLLLRNASEAPSYGGSSPRQLDGIPRPIMGMVGRISGNIDTELLSHLADRLPSISIVNVGMVWRSQYKQLTGKRNIYLLPPVKAEEIPRYIKEFDVCLMPYQKSCGGSPIRFFEYMANQKPIVSTAIPEMSEFRQYAYVAETYSEFVKLAQTALEEGRRDKRGAPYFQHLHTWEARAQALEEFIVTLGKAGVRDRS